MGGIDEVALDCLSLVTEMTRHIRVKASGRKASASKLGQFSPGFIWLPKVIHNLLIITVDFLLFLFVKLLNTFFFSAKGFLFGLGRGQPQNNSAGLPSTCIEASSRWSERCCC